MKYNSLKSRTVKAFEIPVLEGGINLTDLPQNLHNNNLAQGKNIWYKDGSISNRPGLNTKEENIIKDSKITLAQGCSYELTDTTVFYEGKYYKIAYSYVDYDMSSYFICVYLVGEKGAVKSLGYIHLGRTNDSTFYIPHKCIFYVGKAINGGGIYALIALHNRYDDTLVTEKIYEIDKNYSSWSMNYNYYIPTVFINGRGNSYELAEDVGIAFSGKPTVLQPLNTISGSFYAYYTSDGYSSTFRLPFLNIADDSVICRIYYTMSEYAEWIIYSGSTSAESTLQGVAVKMEVDRKKGIVNFATGDSNYAIPQMIKYSENNIRFLAKKEIENGFKDVVSSRCCVTVGSRILLSSGNKIYSTSYDNPLYFPQSFSNDVGSPDDEITALVNVDDKIFAFKENQVYSVELTQGNAINKITLLSDNDDIFYNEDKYKIKCISREVGCTYPATVKGVSGNLIWQSGNGTLILCNGEKLFDISGKIQPFFKEFNGRLNLATAGGNTDFYILCIENKAVIMNYSRTSDAQNAAWYIWEFPEEIRITGATEINNTPVFLCVNDKNVCFAATVDALEDNIVSGTHSDNVIKQQKISSGFKTKNFTLGNIGDRKRISECFLQLESDGLTKIKIGDSTSFNEFELSASDFLNKKRTVVKLITNLDNIRDFALELNVQDNFKLGKCELHFCKTN